MSALRNHIVLSRALTKELRTIRRRGFSFLPDPLALPALVELAVALSPTTGDLTDADRRNLAEVLLRQILHRHVAKDARKRMGIEELLGLNAGSSRRVGARRELAAPYLGYADGESMRQTKIVSEHSSAKYRIEDVLLNRIVKALIFVAVRENLVGPPPPPPIPPPPPTPPRPKPFRLPPLDTKTAKYVGPLGHANGALASEIRAVFIDGIKKALTDNKLPLLTKLADAAYNGPASTRERIEALLTWTIGATDVTGWNQKPALFALAGVDTKRLRGPEARRRRAYRGQFPTRKYDAKEFHPTKEAGIAIGLSEALHELASELRIPCSPCVEDMHARGAFTPAPDPAVNNYLRLWLAIDLGYVEASGGKIISVRYPPIAD